MKQQEKTQTKNCNTKSILTRKKDKYTTKQNPYKEQSYFDIESTQQTDDVKMASLWRRCEVMTSHRRKCDVISTLYSRWENSSQTTDNFK